MKVDIVIPAFGKWDLVQNLLNGLYRWESDHIDRILVVDDCSPEEPNIACKLPLHIVQTEYNSGFTIASNLGLDMVCADDDTQIVFLISSDVKIAGKFIDATYALTYKRRLVGNRHITFDSGWNNFNGVVYDYLEGYFLAATGRVWRELDFFDPAYAPFDYEDVDLSTKAKEKNIGLIALNHPGIVHLGGGTIGYNPQRQAITERNREYFRRKWIKG